MDLAMQERILRLSIPEPNSGCWLWTASENGHGYGNICVGGKNGAVIRAHRASYEAFKGKVPAGLDLDHLCRVRCCVNPDHLQPVTQKENILRGTGWGAKNARKTSCLRGHPFTEDNVYKNGPGRQCKTCARLRALWQRADLKKK